MDDEILDVVDGHDSVIGTVNRKDYDSFLESKRGFIRAAYMFIVNSKSQIWVPVRTANKTIAPNGFDFSAAGHVESGEDYLKTMLREVQEEVNLELTADDLEFVAKLKSNKYRYMRVIYLYRSEITPNYNPSDFVSAEWLSPDELIEKIEQGHPAKGNLRETVEILKIHLKNS